MKESATTGSPPSKTTENGRNKTAGDEARVGHEEKSGG